jgi:formate hydrogenlyase subunit 3/multisubunit Na+/H+ antiporter MnhD subunit
MENSFVLLPIIFLAFGVLGLFTGRPVAKFFPLLASLGAIAALFVGDFNGDIAYSWFGDFSLTLIGSPLRFTFFAMLWFSLFIYSIATLSRPKGEESLTLITAGGMGVALLSGDLLTLFIGWEIMTWGSYLPLISPLISRGNDHKAPRRYLVFSLAGAASLLTGVLVVWQETGSFSFGSLSEMSSIVATSFLLFGFMMKAGVMPLHRWVPSTYDEASDLFAGFMSAALSKAGVFGIIVIVTIVPHTELNGKYIGSILGWLGIATSLFATFRAIRSEEMKELLAWSSISQVGYIVTAVALGSSTGVAAAVFHSINHTIIKLLLFTVVAGIIHRTGKTRFNQLGGLIYKMPFSFIAVLMGIIALAGMPPLSGFASKWLIYSALIEEGKVLQLVVVIASSTAAFIYNYKLVYGIFLGHPTEVNLAETKEIGWFYRIATVLPLLLLMVIGMFPSLVFQAINPVLLELGFAEMVQSSSSVLSTTLGAYNGLYVMNAFGISFAVILVLFSFARAKSRNLHYLDIAYAAETPTEETPLHYGYGVGREMHRIPFIGFWLSKSTKPLYNYLHNLMNQGASLVRLIYNGNIGMLFSAAFFVATLLWIFVVNRGGNS